MTAPDIEDIDLDFRRGYYLAVANLIRLHDLPGVAAELLAEYGPLDLRGVDDYDAAVLRKIVKAEPRYFAPPLTPAASPSHSAPGA